MFWEKNKLKPQKNPDEMEISNLPDKEFKIMFIKMLTKLGRMKEKRSSTELENIRKNQSDLKNILTEIKNLL